MTNSYLEIVESNNKIKIIVNLEDKKLASDIVENDVKILSKIAKNSKKKNIEIITDLDLKNHEDFDNLKWSLISSLNSCKIKDKSKRLEYIYLACCKYLDNEFRINICEFKDDICEGKRYCNRSNGCCYKFKDKYFGIAITNRLELCKYNLNHKCTTECLGCKLYCCDILVKKGIHFTTYNVPLIRHNFNFIQKVIIKTMVFTHKDRILKMLRMFNY